MCKCFGKARAKRIQSRLDEFDAALNLSQIPSDPPPRCHLLKGQYAGKFAVDVSANYRMIFEGYDKRDHLCSNKRRIVTIQIVSIQDYH